MSQVSSPESSPRNSMEVDNGVGIGVLIENTAKADESIQSVVQPIFQEMSAPPSPQGNAPSTPPQGQGSINQQQLQRALEQLGSNSSQPLDIEVAEPEASQTIDEFEVIHSDKVLISQRDNEHACGITCAAMIIVDRGKGTAYSFQDQITEYYHEQPDSPDCRAIEQLLTTYKVSYSPRKVVDVTGINVPALVKGAFRINGKLASHWVIVDRINGEECEIRDPFKGTASKGSVKLLNTALGLTITHNPDDYNMYEILPEKSKSKCCKRCVIL